MYGDMNQLSPTGGGFRGRRKRKRKIKVSQ